MKETGGPMDPPLSEKQGDEGRLDKDSAGATMLLHDAEGQITYGVGSMPITHIRLTFIQVDKA
jgi:hypothetical protein